VCPAGSFAVGQSCVDCPRGYFCPGGTFSASRLPPKQQCPDLMTTIGLRSTSPNKCGGWQWYRAENSIGCGLQLSLQASLARLAVNYSPWHSTHPSISAVIAVMQACSTSDNSAFGTKATGHWQQSTCVCKPAAGSHSTSGSC